MKQLKTTISIIAAVVFAASTVAFLICLFAGVLSVFKWTFITSIISFALFCLTCGGITEENYRDNLERKNRPN